MKREPIVRFSRLMPRPDNQDSRVRIPVTVAGEAPVGAPAGKSPPAGPALILTASGAGGAVRIDIVRPPGGAEDWVGIFQQGQTPGPFSPALLWQYAGGTDGEIEFDGLPPGDYFAAFFSNNGYREIAPRLVFSVGKPAGTVTLPSAGITAGDDLTVHFSGGAGNARDWIGIFLQGAEPGAETLVAFRYVGGSVSGRLGFHLPQLAPGDYFAAMFADDSYVEISNRHPFTARAAPEVAMVETRLDADRIRLGWDTIPGAAYVVERASVPGVWVDFLTVEAASTTHQVVLPGNPDETPRRWHYRVREA
ncbi:MAG: hypothetical protein U1F77_14880 [Kiritimatiellia bacterium]